MAKTREDIELSEAVDATEKELFAAALGDEPAVHDDTGDQSIEHPDRGLEGDPEGIETEVEAADDEAEGDKQGADVEPKKPVEKDLDTGKFVKVAEKDDGNQRVPAGRLRETAERARAAEDRAKAAETEREALKAERETERKERDALRAQMDLLVRQQAAREASQAQPKPEAKAQDAEPDMFADPDGWKSWNRRQIAQAVSEARNAADNRVVNMSLAAAHEAHGDKFTAAWQAFLQMPPGHQETENLKARVRGADNPGAELMRWHRSGETLRRVGNDPDAYEKKLRDDERKAALADPEFRKELLALIKSEAGGNGTQAPRNVIRPAIRTAIPSLNGANGAASLAEMNQAAFDDPSDEGAFNRAFS